MQKDNFRIIFNTGLLFFKLVVCIFLGLFQTRFVLNALGVSDFGIFSLVGSCVAMLSFLNSAMSMSTQRYISYSIGENNLKNTEIVYATAKTLLYRIAFIVLLLLEIIMFFFFDSLFVVPENRIFASKIVFQCVAISSFFVILSVPFDAVLNAYENMISVAAFSFLDVFLRFICAVLLPFVSGDSLVNWSVLLIVISILLFFLKVVYCKRKYGFLINTAEKRSKKLLREIFSFTIFNTFSSFSGIAKSSGVAVVLGMFFSTAVNAAYGIAVQVNGQVMNFSQMLLKAVTPQIVKSKSSKNHQRSLKLSTSSCKFSFFLVSFFALPLILNMPFVLKIWLKNFPEWAVIFCQLFLILSLVGQMTLPLFYFVQAIGNIKLYQLSLGFLQLANLPIIYILCYFGNSPSIALVSTIVIEAIADVLRIYYANKYGNLGVLKFFIRNIIPSSVIVVFAFVLIYFSKYGNNVFFFIVTSSVVELLSCIWIWFVLFDKAERNVICDFMIVVKNKILNFFKNGRNYV